MHPFASFERYTIMSHVRYRFDHDAAELCMGEHRAILCRKDMHSSYAAASVARAVLSYHATRTQSFPIWLCPYFEAFEVFERQLSLDTNANCFKGFELS